MNGFYMVGTSFIKELNKLQYVTKFSNLYSVHLETSLTFIHSFISLFQEQFLILILFILSFFIG